jgi:hypothetical protein
MHHYIRGIRLGAYRGGHMNIIKRLCKQYEIVVGIKDNGLMGFSFTNNFDGGFALSHIARHVSYLCHSDEHDETFIEDYIELMVAAVINGNIKLVKMVIIKLKLFINKRMEITSETLIKIIEKYGSCYIRHVLSAGWLEACKRGNAEIAALCINPLRNKQLKLTDSHIDSGMIFAIENGHMPIVKLIISMIHGDTQKQYVHPRIDTWFLTACGTGNVDMVYLFMHPQDIKHGLNGSNKFDDGLMMACHNGHANIAQLMLTSLKCFSSRDYINHLNKCLEIVCKGVYQHIACLLVTHGANHCSRCQTSAANCKTAKLA